MPPPDWPVVKFLNYSLMQGGVPACVAPPLGWWSRAFKKADCRSHKEQANKEHRTQDTHVALGQKLQGPRTET